MPTTLLLVGTRKGCFVLESDGDRRDWTLRGPYCESWPVYHAVHDPALGLDLRRRRERVARRRPSGAAPTSARRWALSSEGLAYGEDGERKLSKVSSLAAAHGRVLVGVEAPGIFESRDGGETWSLLTTLDGQPGREDWDDPANQPPGHLGLSALMPDADDPSRFWAIVQGFGIFETTDDGDVVDAAQPGLRADWPREHEEVGFCVHRLVRSPRRPEPACTSRTTSACTAATTAAHSWIEITEGLPSEFGFAAAAHPHDRDTFYVIPLDPGHGRCMPDGQAAVWRTRDAGSSWQRLDHGLPQRDAHLGVLRDGDGDRRATTSPGLYFGTSTGQVFASADEGESWSEIASYLPAISSVEVAVLE